MSNGNTKYRKSYNLKATIFSILFLVIFMGLLVYFLLNADNVLEIVVCLIFLTLIIFGLIGILAGILKGKMQIVKENRYIKKTNPYIYYRELPNSFGIGVTSLLFDSTIENHKDIVAVILDLCARKYLNLIKQNDKYIIQILKPVDDNLLSNEKYILTYVILIVPFYLINLLTGFKNIAKQTKDINYKNIMENTLDNINLDNIEINLSF